jgi:hypothetical protein
MMVSTAMASGTPMKAPGMPHSSAAKNTANTTRNGEIARALPDSSSASSRGSRHARAAGSSISARRRAWGSRWKPDGDYQRPLQQREADMKKMLADWKPDEHPEVVQMMRQLAQSFASSPPTRP